MKYDFVAVGGATRDVSFLTDQGVLIKNHSDLLRQELLGFEYGAKIKVDKFRYSFGGGAANAAVNFSGLGLKSACIAVVGEDEGGRLIVANLKSRGVDYRRVRALAGIDSGASFILVTPAGERIIFAQRGANRDLVIDRADEKLIRQAKNIYIASLSGDWLENLRKIFNIASVTGAPIFWNPGARQYSGGLKKIASFISRTKVFALNKDEAIELVLSSSRHDRQERAWLNKTENLLRVIKSFGPEIVVITLGAAGVAVYDGRKFYKYPALKEKKRVDTTGVGDVFNSSFAAGLEIYSGDIDRAIKLSLKNTASKIAHFGAQNGLLKLNLKKK